MSGGPAAARAAREPTPSRYPHVLPRLLAATRPAFLSITAVAVLLGLASAAADGIAIAPARACVAALFALVAHAAGNLLNDYHDALNGSDAANHARRFPFTGGSRFIQNGVLTAASVARLAYLLLASVVVAGAWLVAVSGGGLLAIGLLGLALAWGYSAPPLALMNRGVGEAVVALAWLLVVVGTDYVQRGGFAATPWWVGLAYALHVAGVLGVNAFPDCAADAAAGKRTLAVRLGARRGRGLYAVLVLPAYAWLAFAVTRGALPWTVVLAGLGLPPALLAARGLWRHAAQPAVLDRTIVAAILAAHVHGLALAAALLLG
ncbi:MAG: prenyltransferase [Gammaproteobacteria bacterium]|nr:prenyltransferase [Gammaproteobacteria bacterium]MCP5200085.1 prenyltransferase [Gammaproteobacteria bacterium]